MFSLVAPSSLALCGVPCRMVFSMVLCRVSGDVVKPGELVSFYCCQQGLLLSSKGGYVLSHIFVCLHSVYEMWRSLLKHFVSNVYMHLSVSAVMQSPALVSIEEDGYSKCSVESKLGFEADISALPDVLT